MATEATAGMQDLSELSNTGWGAATAYFQDLQAAFTISDETFVTTLIVINLIIFLFWRWRRCANLFKEESRLHQGTIMSLNKMRNDCNEFSLECSDLKSRLESEKSNSVACQKEIETLKGDERNLINKYKRPLQEVLAEFFDDETTQALVSLPGVVKDLTGQISTSVAVESPVAHEGDELVSLVKRDHEHGGVVSFNKETMTQLKDMLATLEQVVSITPAGQPSELADIKEVLSGMQGELHSLREEVDTEFSSTREAIADLPSSQSDEITSDDTQEIKYLLEKIVAALGNEEDGSIVDTIRKSLKIDFVNDNLRSANPAKMLEALDDIFQDLGLQFIPISDNWDKAEARQCLEDHKNEY